MDTEVRHIDRRGLISLVAGGLVAYPFVPGLKARCQKEQSKAGQSSQKLLFLDQSHLEKTEGARLRIHPPRKTGEALLTSEHPWESATLNWFTVLKEGQRYRMWYECYDTEGWPTTDDTSFCYAESTDGIRWEKPQLGLTNYQGSKANNILFRQVGAGNHRSRVHGSCVFIDPEAPPEARYKCVSQGQFQGIGDRPYYVAGMVSPDGLRWTRLPKPICPVFADSQYSGFWDGAQRTYRLYGRTTGRGGRAIGLARSDRFDTFPALTDRRVLETAVEDAPGRDLYNPACQAYPREPGWYLMFPSLFRHKEDTLEIRLAVSRDGEKWSWPDRETALIPLGKTGGFDCGSLYLGNGGCLPTADGFSFYFSGSPLKHEQVDLPQLKDPKNRRVISRAVAPKDRLVSVSSGEAGGWLVTQAFRCVGEELYLNANAPPGGIRVAIVDTEGNPLPGFTLKDCKPLGGDSVRHAVSFAGNTEWKNLRGKMARLRVEMKSGDLFAVEME